LAAVLVVEWGAQSLALMEVVQAQLLHGLAPLCLFLMSCVFLLVLVAQIELVEVQQQLSIKQKMERVTRF
jgi:hypothetical protein